MNIWLERIHTHTSWTKYWGAAKNRTPSNTLARVKVRKPLARGAARWAISLLHRRRPTGYWKRRSRPLSLPPAIHQRSEIGFETAAAVEKRHCIDNHISHRWTLDTSEDNSKCAKEPRYCLKVIIYFWWIMDFLHTFFYIVWTTGCSLNIASFPWTILILLNSDTSAGNWSDLWRSGAALKHWHHRGKHKWASVED